MRQSDDDLRKELRDLVDRLTDEDRIAVRWGKCRSRLATNFSSAGTAVLDDLSWLVWEQFQVTTCLCRPIPTQASQNASDARAC